MKRNNLSVRFSTSVGQKLPSYWKAKVVKFSEMEEEGMEEIPKEILNAIDSFNVESDEEFLGFE
jgi:selenocysteine-specific translation elongation factor